MKICVNIKTKIIINTATSVTALNFSEINRATLPPNFLSRKAMAKYLKKRPDIDASINIKKDIPKNPPDIVNTLYGIGVKAAMNVVINA